MTFKPIPFKILKELLPNFTKTKDEKPPKNKSITSFIPNTREKGDIFIENKTLSFENIGFHLNDITHWIDQEKLNNIVSGWNSVDEVQPPDKTYLKLKDEFGNIGHGHPTYLPFKLEKMPGMGKWETNVTNCEPFWDGGWLIGNDGMKPSLEGNVVSWAFMDK